MDLIILAVKSDLNNSLNAGRYMLASFFLVAVFTSYVGILTRHVNWADVIIRLVIGFILLQNYTWVMDTTRNIVVSVDEMVNPNQDFASQYSIMSQNIQKRHEAATRKSILTQIKEGFFGPFSLHNIVINLSFMAYAVISKIIESVRYCLTAILYKLGPVLIPLVLFRSTAEVVRGWYTSYVSVLCWPILWHIVLSIAVNLSDQTMASGGVVEQFASINFGICFVLIFSPFIVNSLVSGIGAGASAGMGGVMSTGAVAKAVTFLGGGMKSAADRFQTPTTALGKFKDVMLGGDKGKGGK